MAYKKLSEVSDYVSEKINNSLLTVDTFIGVDNMLPNCQGIVQATYKPDIGNSTAFKVGDILIGNIRPYFKKIWFATFDGGCSADVLVIRSKEKENAKFLFAALSTDNFFNYDMAGSKGSKMPRGDKDHIMNYKIKFVDNYNKIGNILFFINSQIERNNAMVQKLPTFRTTTYCISHKEGELRYAC